MNSCAIIAISLLLAMTTQGSSCDQADNTEPATDNPPTTVMSEVDELAQSDDTDEDEKTTTNDRVERDDSDVFNHMAFDAILRTNVKNERVDYTNIKKNHLPELSIYLDQLAKVNIDDLARDQQLAYYINLYNATVIRNVIDRYKPGYSVSENDFQIFKDNLVRTTAGTYSLNHLENNVIRPTFKDARIHAALNCAAASCPPLLDHAYTADNLNETLTKQMRRFVNDPTRNTIKPESKKLILSKLFEWYAEDFGGPNGVPGYINKYTDRDVSGYTVSFQDYSWTLNNSK